MLGAERRGVILEHAQRDGLVRVADLVPLLRVSDVTVRRDIDLLVQEGLLEKVYGGAVLPRVNPAPTPGNPVMSQAHRFSGTHGAAADPRTIGMLVPKSPYYFKNVVDGVRGVLPENTRLILAVSDYEPEKEHDLVAGLLDSGATALLLAPAYLAEQSVTAATWLDRLEVPVVLVERRLEYCAQPRVFSVRTAHESGSARAVRHLVELGHRRIALFARGETTTSFAVQRGWSAALKAWDLPTDVPALTGQDIPGWPRWDAAQVERLANKLKQAGATALVCHSDEDALALLQNGLTTHLDVPGELSIVAYDDEFSEYAHPALTAVAPPKQEVGAVAARMLLEYLAGGIESVRHVEIEPRLIVRSSSAAPRYEERSRAD